jgi:pimeloyl-ACP methyl ester carboxylesterase
MCGVNRSPWVLAELDKLDDALVPEPGLRVVEFGGDHRRHGELHMRLRESSRQRRPDLPRIVATFALIHGGGGSAWDWHLVVPELRERGQQVVAVDLPSDDESAGWWDYADAVVDLVGYRSDLVVVGHFLGGFTAPLVCARVPVDLVVLLAAMIPAPGELFSDWWTNTGYRASGYEDVFYHDIAPELVAEARQRERDENSRALRQPWPLPTWPEVRTKYLMCREDRMFPAEGHVATPVSGSESSPTRLTAGTTSR